VLEAFVQVFVKTFVQWFEPSHYIKVPSYMQAVVSQVVREDSKHLVRSPVVAGLREAYSLYRAGTHTLMFLFVLFSSLYQTAAYAMGKHVPGDNLFPTVWLADRQRQRSLRMYASNACTINVPTERGRRRRDERVYLSTIDDRPTVRLRTLAPYCYPNSPFWWILSYVSCGFASCEERNH